MLCCCAPTICYHLTNWAHSSSWKPSLAIVSLSLTARILKSLEFLGIAALHFLLLLNWPSIHCNFPPCTCILRIVALKFLCYDLVATLCNIVTQNNKWPLCSDLGPCLWHVGTGWKSWVEFEKERNQVGHYSYHILHPSGLKVRAQVTSQAVNGS